MKEQQEASTKKLDSMQPNISSERTVNPNLIIDGNKLTPYDILSKLFNGISLKARFLTVLIIQHLNFLNEMLRDCKNLNLPLKHQQKFQVMSANFLPFNYNENGIARKPANDSNFKLVQIKLTHT